MIDQTKISISGHVWGVCAQVWAGWGSGWAGVGEGVGTWARVCECVG